MSKYENRIARLEREAAPRTKPVRLAPEKRDTVSPAHRGAVLAQLRHELLFGGTRESGPFPSRGLHPRAAALFRARVLGTREFEQLEQQISADRRAGPRIFGADWPYVAAVFAAGAAPSRRLPALEPTDLSAWRRARWAEFLASDEGKAAVESGRLHPAPEFS